MTFMVFYSVNFIISHTQNLFLLSCDQLTKCQISGVFSESPVFSCKSKYKQHKIITNMYIFFKIVKRLRCILKMFLMLK